MNLYNTSIIYSLIAPRISYLLITGMVIGMGVGIGIVLASGVLLIIAIIIFIIR